MTHTNALGIIALVPDHWDSVVMPRHQVLKRLAKHFPVIWVEPAPTWRECARSGETSFLRPDRWTSPTPGLHVFSPGWCHPRVFRPNWLHQFTLRSRLAAARRKLVSYGATSIGLYLWRDEFAEALDFVPHDFSCYHVDDEYSFDEHDLPNSPREIELLRRVDLVIVHSQSLMLKKGGINPNTTRIPNGVDYQAYSTPQKEPPDLLPIAHPRVGYAGVIKKQLDLEQLARLAAARPNYSFVMVGPVLNVAGKENAIAQLHRMRNVHFLGNKPVWQLPGYVQHFDVCLMCYEVNDYTKYIYPLKLNEYLASGRPIVSAPIAEVTGLEPLVTLAATDQQWLDSIDGHLSPGANSATAAAARRHSASLHDWDHLVDQIAGNMRQALERRIAPLGAASPVN